MYYHGQTLASPVQIDKTWSEWKLQSAEPASGLKMFPGPESPQYAFAFLYIAAAVCHYSTWSTTHL